MSDLPEGDAVPELAEGSLPKGWVETSLGDMGLLARGKSKHRPRWATHLFGGDYPFIQTGEVKSAGKYITTFEKTYSEAGLAQSKLWGKDTLCITIAANIAEISILRFPACFPDSVLGFIPDKEKCNLDFVYYFFSTVQAKLRQLAIGSVQDNINLATFEKLPFLFPPLPEQKAIADMLSSLDEKIELLREQNKTLETLAQTIFKEWFVHFNSPDPHGKPYRNNGGEMAESELGLIPKGWRVGKLKEICDIKNGFAFKSKDYVDSGVPVVRTTNFKSGSVDLKAPVFLTKEKSQEFKSYFLEKFDFLLVMVGASIGKNVITPSHILPALQNQNMWNFKPKDKSLIFYNIFLLRRLVFQQANSSSGSARDFFRKDYFYSLDTAVPDRHVLMNFSNTVKPLFEKLDNNIIQIKSLSKARDMLLPKLMSGQVRVQA